MQLNWLALVFLPLAAMSTEDVRHDSITASDVLRHENGLWSLETVDSIRRWVVIHNLRDADEHTVLHIEVLARKAGAPAWQFDRLAAHMAITMNALTHSVRRPLVRGAVYPESFDNGFRLWTQQSRIGAAPVCTTTVDRCLKGDW
jgi:hypothetical protein